jgi:hypothetical protein
MKALATEFNSEPQSLGWDPNDKVITWSNENLHHLVAENDVYLAFHQACKQSQIELCTWKSDRTLYQEHQGKQVAYAGPHGGTYTKVLIPDGYYEFTRPITTNGRTGKLIDRIMLEVDMGTQTLKQRQQMIKNPQRTWEHKVKAYLAYFQPGGVYEQMYGSIAGRVLTITTSDERMCNMQQVTEEVGGNERFWFSTFVDFVPERLLCEPIYTVASRATGGYCLFEGFDP